MATSFLKKTMVYLGLLDDEYDEYDEYDDRGTGGTRPPPVPTSARRRSTSPRSVPRPHRSPDPDPAPRGHGAAQAQPAVTPRATSTSASVRPMSVGDRQGPRRRPVALRRRQGDRRRAEGEPAVIVNLQVADRDLQRRMIDFCSGVTYALSGEMEKVADESSCWRHQRQGLDEERQRLQEVASGAEAVGDRPHVRGCHQVR